ncbi:MAG TPA: ATP-binding protein [Chthoniobacterales bacterium]|nr:ATP-binding protein [Chthoniobacterales bacterium]
MSERMELLPDPVRMVEGLRDTGYQFNTAVADVVDNSVAAEASFVEIELMMDFKGNITLAIYDDGIGMDRAALINAMKYGSKPRPSAASLGKFGLGLKTASTAFCRKLVVISRDSASAPLLRAVWDLDHVRDEKKWELIIDEPTAKQREAFARVIGDRRGTMVLWEKVDRLLRNYDNLGGAPAQNALKKIRDSLKHHLRTVYERFLDVADPRARHVTMKLNGEDVLPWDPFCRAESELVSDEAPEVDLPGGGSAEFRLKAYVLPRKEEFSSDEAAKNARISNPNQGIYIYRENRLIHGPDWLSMFTKEPHFSLLRAEFSFDHQLDDAFQIDIKKSQILLNEALYDHIVDFLTPPRRAAEQAYRRGTKAKTAAAAKSAHDSSNRNISSKEGAINTPEVKGVDAEKNEAELVNKQGPVRLKLKITTAAKPLEVHVQPVDSIDDGLLWEPCLIDGHYGVRVNTGHPYYHKVYVPNITEGVMIQGMDALLWGLSTAELNCISEATKATFGELRYEVSRNLRKLVEDMPEPPLPE